MIYGLLMRPARRPKTIKARVSTETYNTITRIALLTGKSVSETVADILEDLLPGLKQTKIMLEQSAKLNAAAQNNLIKTIEKQESKLKGTDEIIEDDEKDNTAEFLNLKLPL